MKKHYITPLMRSVEINNICIIEGSNPYGPDSEIIDITPTDGGEDIIAPPPPSSTRARGLWHEW